MTHLLAPASLEGEGRRGSPASKTASAERASRLRMEGEKRGRERERQRAAADRAWHPTPPITRALLPILSEHTEANAQPRIKER